MITVADILALPAFEQVELLAPVRSAGERRVYNVGIMDCPPSIRHYDNYYPDEFILTNLGFCPNDADAGDEALIAMIERRVAAIAIKRVYRPAFSGRVAEASLRMGVPCFLYSGAYHEEVTYQALNLLHRDEEAQDKSEAVDALLAGRSSTEKRRDMYELAGLTGTTMRCIAVSAKEDDRCSLYAVQDSLNDHLEAFCQRFDDVEAAVAVRYHDSLLALASYKARTARGELLPDLENAIEGIGPARYGVGDLVSLGSTDISIRQAVMLLSIAQARRVRRLEWTDLGFEAFALAARVSPLFDHTATECRRVLDEYDAAHGAELVSTAKAFVRSLGEAQIAAKAVHQHPNTVRYRLRRVRELLRMEEASDRELLMFLTLMLIA